jgi:hypothetical protein
MDNMVTKQIGLNFDSTNKQQVCTTVEKKQEACTTEKINNKSAQNILFYGGTWRLKARKIRLVNIISPISRNLNLFQE